jgi:alpha-1,4-glucan:alpha-1,4-glucan 6-glycosyltransferase
VDRRRHSPRDWPVRLRNGKIRSDDYDPADRDYHLYVQWIAGEQLAGAAARARAHGPGLYLDLPVGVHPEGYDVWREPSLYTRAVSVGAPPDPLAPQGQDWGFPAIRPSALVSGGAHHVIEYVRHHMQHAGVLRVDHFMGLERLFWIPSGMKSKEGAYVRYPREILHAILCLESIRNRTIVVGEDLGTVPHGMRERMARRGFLRMHVTQTELTSSAGHALGGAPASAVASFGTHDMPLFAAFQSGADLDTWQAIGVLPPDQAEAARAARERTRREFETELTSRGLVRPSASKEDLHRGMQLALASGNAAITMATLEDLWLEDRPHNIPGTLTEHANWRRRSTRSLDDIASSDSLRELFRSIDRARRGGASNGPARAEEPLPPLEAVTTGTRELYLFHEGSYFRMYDTFGAHPAEDRGSRGVHFTLWAPNARSVHVFGSFNGWSKTATPMHGQGDSGVWRAFVAGAKHGDAYKYHLVSRDGGKDGDKADPLAFSAEVPPHTASIVCSPSYSWTDHDWMAERQARHDPSKPLSIYEMHLGSWRHGHGRPLTYRELAEALPSYLTRLGFTHVELLPIMEHPFSGSWGYQTTGYFAPTSRFGPPEDFMALIDRLHEAKIGVILDWVPSHFPSDGHGLAYFDGTYLYEHADPRKGFHPDWKSHIFNYGRHEVRSFLISSALYWLDRYHIDGIRVDAVASMLYLDYSRKEGEWIPNERGGRENLEAITFLTRLNEAIETHHPGVLRIAEESTAWPGITKDTSRGGLSFDYKWDMGWMHDTLKYMSLDPIHRRHHHNTLTFRMLYAYTERFLLALSHDEVVHGKRSLLSKMPGDWWQKFANLRTLFGYMFGMSGKKLLFMGAELGQWTEWNHDTSLDWALEREPMHAGLQRWVSRLNQAYRDHPALHELDVDPAGFEWIDCHDQERSTLSMLRKSREGRQLVVILCNFTPVPRPSFRIGVPVAGTWRLLLNGDEREFGGSGVGIAAELATEGRAANGRGQSITLTLPPLATVFLVWP